MKKQIYIAPQTLITKIGTCMPLALSNNYDGGKTVTLNPNTMETGDGNDAVKGNNNAVQWDGWE